MHFLTPVLRDYAWGTTHDIPQLLGIRHNGQPVAEAWWGAHDSSPSRVHNHSGPAPLDELVGTDPEGCLGPDAVARWGARLPFLLKILAIHKPLSIQVHPTLEQAREGFAREQRGTGGLPHQFLDPFHKPEMVVALTPMTILAGVRDLDVIADDLRQLGTPGAHVLRATLARGDLHDFISAAIAGAADDHTLAALAEAGDAAPHGSSLAVAASALRSFPGDSGALIALGLNAVELAKGEAIYTGAGVLHSYQSGVGIEIMANSDNVVRAGLTPKTIDVPLLLELSHTEPCAPGRPERTEGDGHVHLTTDAEEFALTVVTREASIPAGPRIVLAVEGAASIHSESGSLDLIRGQAAFVAYSDGPVEVRSQGLTAVARVP
ncbi:mannose-6-phosphate isomerase, class I [Demequina sp.]|uniref:mannose-6-phosphate isomerase, class I n=1 Tax=Demequina sp. TaxID=2050685 RepID=UPI003A83E339